jgi:23S rRNA pseudouridine1911/1915/1917 synthase
VERIFGAASGAALKPSLFPGDRNLPMPPARFSELRLTPKTGRTHQLRVHLSAIGFPIVGDTLYGGRVFEAGDFRFDRQALHAHEITFVHPATLNEMTLTAPIPEDMRRLMEIMDNG